MKYLIQRISLSRESLQIFYLIQSYHRGLLEKTSEQRPESKDTDFYTLEVRIFFGCNQKGGDLFSDSDKKRN